MARHCIYGGVLLMTEEGIWARIQTLPLQTCLVCGSPSFEPTADTFDFREILERWERETGVTFSKTVLEQYTSCQTKQVTLYHCNECGFGLFQPVIVGSQEFYADIAVADKYYLSKKWEFVQAIRDLKKYRIRKVLDVGCGNGYFLDLLRDSRLEIESAGYEFNPQVANLARGKGHNVYNGTFPEDILATTGNGYFDAVCTFQILEHVSDPIGFIRNVIRLLDSNGILIVGVPDARGPVRYFSSALTDIPPHHVSRWCESVFRLGITRLGFRVFRKAYEPLPYYLWPSYLPVILERGILPGAIGRFLNRIGFVQRLIQGLTRVGISGLWGIRGHTLYVVLKRDQNIRN